MHILFLTGNNQRNVEWAKTLKSTFERVGYTASLIYSDTWKMDTSGDLDMSYEFEESARILKEIHDYIICSISTGGLIALRGMYEKKYTPKKCIFIGIPIVWGYDRFSHENAWLEHLHVPSLFIQKNADPITSSGMLKRILKKTNVQNSRLHELVGHTHTYNETDEIFEECVEFLRMG